MSDERYNTILGMFTELERRIVEQLRAEMRLGFARYEAQHKLIMEAIERPSLDLSKDFHETKQFHHRRLLRLEKNAAKQAPF